MFLNFVLHVVKRYVVKSDYSCAPVETAAVNSSIRNKNSRFQVILSSDLIYNAKCPVMLVIFHTNVINVFSYSMFQHQWMGKILTSNVVLDLLQCSGVFLSEVKH